MKLSLNEISSLVTRAGVGAGWPVGLAEEAAAAAVALASLGHDGVAAALDGFADAPEAAGPPALLAGETAVFPDARIVAAGPSGFDLLQAGTVSEVRFDGTDAPALLIGLALEASTRGRRFTLTLSASDYALPRDAAAALAVLMPGAALLLAPEDGPPPGPLPQPDRATVSDGAYAAARALAARTYVPASDASRTGGAGAGLSDND